MSVKRDNTVTHALVALLELAHNRLGQVYQAKHFERQHNVSFWEVVGHRTVRLEHDLDVFVRDVSDMLATADQASIVDQAAGVASQLWPPFR